MKIRYITIEREYGSGGTRIAREASRLCGVPCYGQELLERVSRRTNLPVKALQDYEESVSGSFLYSMYVMTQSQTGDPDLLSGEAKLYVAETKEIRELASAGPCIFVGHCAGHALREQEGVLHVFIRASQEDKHRRITQEYGIPAQNAQTVRKSFDKKRANYYAFCTKNKWKDPNNYDLIMDSSRLGVEGCAAVLAQLFLQEK